MNMQIILVIIASVLAFVGNIAYLKDVVRGKVRPHPYTWFIWSIVSLVTFLGGLEKGAGIDAIPTAVAEGFTIIIFLYAVARLFKRSGATIHVRKHEIGHIRPIDHIFLVVALLGLIPWALTKDPTISVIVVVTIDVIAFIPTLRKTWAHPETEQPLLYQMNVTRHILTLFSLGAFNVATALHSVAMIITNTVMTIFITGGRGEKRGRK
jgi:hypothetical protein